MDCDKDYAWFRQEMNTLILRFNEISKDEENDTIYRGCKHIQQLLKIAGEITLDMEGWL